MSVSPFQSSAMPRPLPRTCSVLALTLLTLLGACSDASDKSEPTSSGPSCTGEQCTGDETPPPELELINRARSQARFCGERQFPAAPALRWNENLETAARRHSEDMAAHNFFSHTGSDGSSFAERVSATGYRWRRVAENVAAGQRDAETAIEGWIASPGHCENLMNASYEEVGMSGIEVRNTDYRYYWTQVFATRR